MRGVVIVELKKKGKNMSDLISRSALMEALEKEQKECEIDMTSPNFFKAKMIAREQPTIEAVPVVHGKWIPHKRMARSPLVMNYACSVCGKDGNQTNFCPNCGAKMDGGKE